MGAFQRSSKAVFVAAVLCAGARAAASVQVDPIARLSLEGGYDSNVLYDGRGGDNMARVSPELGLALRDHTWSASLAGAADVLFYQQQSSSPVWNGRGVFSLRGRPDRRTEIEVDL